MQRYLQFMRLLLVLWSLSCGAFAASIYHSGWIDLNKNGKKDPYEDPAAPLEQRLDDLLASMTVEEKTAQMVTLYSPTAHTHMLPSPRTWCGHMVRP